MVHPGNTSTSTFKRRPSLLNIFRSNTDTRPSTSRSTDTSRSGLRKASNQIRTLYDSTFRNTQPNFQMMAPTKRPATTQTQTRPQISRLTKTFADSLTATKLSNFLAWFLYYDVVELPRSAEAWFAPLDNMDIHGWAALGDFISESASTGYGLDLVVLDSICDRLRLRRSNVHDILTHFSDPDAMTLTQIATLTRTASQAGISTLGVLDMANEKLVALRRLVANLKPEKDTIYELWCDLTLKHIRNLISLVIIPHILHLRFGAPLITAATGEQVPQKIKNGIELRFRFEACQMERQVPFARYGIYETHRSSPQKRATPSPPPHQEVNKPAANLGVDLANPGAVLREIRQLRSRNARLVLDNQGLEDSNAQLTRKITQLSTHTHRALLARALSESPTREPQQTTPYPSQDQNDTVIINPPAHVCHMRRVSPPRKLILAPSPMPRPISTGQDDALPLQSLIPPIPQRSALRALRSRTAHARDCRRSGFVGVEEFVRASQSVEEEMAAWKVDGR